MGKREFETSGKPIRTCPGENGVKPVYFPYTPKRLEKIKTVVGPRWDPDTKCWSIPHSEGIIEQLRSLFKGEQVEIDPSLIASEPQCTPENPEFQQTGLLMEMARELRLRGYRFKTRKTYLGHVERFIQSHKKDPKSLDRADVRAFVHSLLEQDKSHSYVG